MRFIKDNRFIRGLYFFIHTYIRPQKKKFGYLGTNVILTPPISLSKVSNIYIYDNVGIGPYSIISAVNANFIIKGNCAIAERFTVHTGNHAMILKQFCTSVTEDKKPKGYDKDIIVEEDVWIGCNVTLLSGVTSKIGFPSEVIPLAILRESTT